jgi:hypothetical protein
MHYVSLIVEFLRGRPAVVFWTAALTQAALWVIVPSLVYFSPPGDLPILLAIGHEFHLGSYLGPPLAFWFGEIAFRLAGMVGVYVLAQVCVVVAYWAIFTLGRSIVGTRHAVLAVLLMVGIAAFSVPTAEFAPSVLAMPLWALALLHYWRALGEGKRGYWFLLALDLGLLLLASYVGLILIALLVVFTPLTARGRAAFWHPEPYIAVLLFLIVVTPHVVWLATSYKLVLATFEETRRATAMTPWLWLVVTLMLSHLGLIVLVVLASGWRADRRQRAPEIDRAPVETAARVYVYTFALLPALVAIGLAAWGGHISPFERVGPLLLLSALMVLVFAGDRILLYRERLVSSAWLGLLTVPPLLVLLGVLLLPWTIGADLKVGQPQSAMSKFFAESFERRTGQPLTYVAGDTRLAGLIALGAPSRPHLYFADHPERSPWTTLEQVRDGGAILLWPATDTAGAPPAVLKALFPAIVPEVPRAFARPVQGLLPLIRVGWAVVRPGQATSQPASQR